MKSPVHSLPVGKACSSCGSLYPSTSGSFFVSAEGYRVCAGEFLRFHQPKNPPAAQNEPWEFELPEADPTNADPTPIHWLGAAVPGTTRRSGPASPRTLSAVPGQTSTHRARLLHPHDHRRRLRRPDPRATLPLPDLPPHRVPAARVRAALPAFQRYGDRAVPRRAPAPGENSRRRTAAIVALPARPVLAAPLPRASRSVVRRVGRADQARPRAWLRSTCARHARILRLGPRSSLPFRQRPPAPAGLS